MTTTTTLLAQASTWLPRLHAALSLPRGEQIGALQALRRALPPIPDDEAWNSAFGPGSLFAAWTASPLTQPLYAANAASLAPIVARPGFVAVEIGGGDGALWRVALPPTARGTLHVIDPHPEPAAQVARACPPGVEVVAHLGAVPGLPVPEADAVVCSLTLHHVAGADAAERAHVGLPGPGKVEALRELRAAIAPRSGLLLLNEADVFCDVALAPGDPLLADRIVDSYLRRCGRALADAIDGDADPSLRARWWLILRRWCLDQLAVAQAPIADRDVYELDVPRWLVLLDEAGLEVVERRFTDRWALFHQYVCRARR